MLSYLEIDAEDISDQAAIISDFESQIQYLVVALEKERERLAQYSIARDISRDTYLVSVEELEILSFIQDQVGENTVISSTVFPVEEVDNQPVQIAAGAGVSTIVVMILVALMIEWWKRSKAEKQMPSDVSS